MQNADAIKAKGVDAIACVSVNDAFVMGAWARDQGTGETIDMLADGSGELAKGMDIELTSRRAGWVKGKRRLVAEDGVVKHLALQDGGELHDFERRRNVEGAPDDRLLILRNRPSMLRGHFSFGLRARHCVRAHPRVRSLNARHAL